MSLPYRSQATLQVCVLDNSEGDIIGLSTELSLVCMLVFTLDIKYLIALTFLSVIEQLM